jgi:hypothetical protein
MTNDKNHLKLLSTFHYVVGGIGCFFACMPLLHTAIGAALVFFPDVLQGNHGDAPPEFIGWIFLIMGLFFFIIGQGVSICMILSGRFIAKRKNYLFSFVLACIECMFVPFGTVLGVFTIVVLSRDSVKALYSEADKQNE